MPRKLAVLVLIYLGASYRADAESVYLREEAVVAQTWYACPNKDDLQFHKTLSREKWRIGHLYAEAHGCHILKAGDVGVVANALIWTGDTCLRTMATEPCAWFPEGYVIREDSAVGSIK